MRPAGVLALTGIAAAATACHMLVGLKQDPLPVCTVPPGLETSSTSERPCERCLEDRCCNQVGACGDTPGCKEEFGATGKCVRDDLAFSADNRPEVPDWIARDCAPSSARGREAFLCMMQRCTEECFPPCGSDAADDGSCRPCKLDPALPPLTGTGCDERRLEQSCCSDINDCMADRYCRRVVECMHRNDCLYAIAFGDITCDPCGSKCAAETYGFSISEDAGVHPCGLDRPRPAEPFDAQAAPTPFKLTDAIGRCIVGAGVCRARDAGVDSGAGSGAGSVDASNDGPTE
jgi:hypothetical protein